MLQLLWARTKRPTRGEELVKALEEAQAPPEDGVKDPAAVAAVPRSASAAAPRESRPSRAVRVGPAPVDLLRTLSYVRAAAWVAVRLASRQPVFSLMKNRSCYGANSRANYFDPAPTLATLSAPSFGMRVKNGKKGVISKGIFSRARAKGTARAFISSTRSLQGSSLILPPSGRAAI